MIKNIKSHYKNLPLAVRKVLRRMIGSYVILIIIFSAATYLYVLRYGAKIPLDGIPFLKTISIFSSVLLTAVSLLTIGFAPIGEDNVFTQPLASKTEGSGDTPDESKLENENSHKNIERSDYYRLEKVTRYNRVRKYLFALLVLLGGATIIATVQSALLSGQSLNSITTIPIMFSIGVALFVVYSACVYFGRISSIWIDRINSGIYWSAIGFILLLLSGPYFQHFLQTTRFGGGIAVAVQTTDNGVYLGNLFLVTNSNVVVWSPIKGQFFDLNNEEIISVGTLPGGTIQMPPERSLYSIIISEEERCHHPAKLNGSNVCNAQPVNP